MLMPEKPWGLGQLLNSLFGKEVMTPGPSTVSADGPFAQYGILPPNSADQGPLSKLFPDGATPTQRDLLPPWATQGLDAATPLLLLSGLAAANSFGTGQPPAFPSRPGGTMTFARPSDALAKLMMAQQRARGR